ncbi:MAG: type III pantothenate kinase [Alphaproteobacteria bacterium]|nr:type III pantothenate kinase [Alphaproteobacteria bacterium]MCB9690435.1 type III pantothenate kinase [Alphaproteobacteria bacterium]
MFLAIDVGNTHTQFGVMRGTEVLATFRLTTARRSTDELGVLVLTLLQHRGIAVEALEGAIASCVVPGVLYGLEKAVKRYLGLDVMVVGRGLKTGLRIRTENPKELGSDRIVNAVGARARWDGPLVVIDLGTATLFDCVDGRGDYLGGVIAPGFQVSQQALERRSARLPGVEVARPERTIGKNTSQAFQSGMFWGFVGLVDGLARRCREELGGTATVVATGEWSALVGPAAEEVEHVEAWLTLTGLADLYGRNQATPRA